MSITDDRTIFGWGVFRIDPWHFVGVFPTCDAAEQEARANGEHYLVRYGSNEKGTENFTWKNESLVYGFGGSEDTADNHPMAEAYADPF